MASTKVRVYIDNAAFLALNFPNGPIGGFTNRLVYEAVVLARHTAPRRTGRLARSIRHKTMETNLRGVIVRLSAGSAYAKFVHNGTKGHISPSGMTLYAPSGRYGNRRPDAVAGGYPTFVGAKKFIVAGQDAQPWLRDALRTTKARLVH